VSPFAELFDRRVKARSLSYLFAAGAALGLLTLVFPHDEQVKDFQLVILAGVAFGIAAGLSWRADGLTDRDLHVALALGTLILTLANYFTGPTALYALLYTWVALYAFYFFGLREALLHVALIAVSYGLLLALEDHPSAVTRWLLAVGTPTVVGLLISQLLGRLRSEAVHSQRRAAELRQTEARTRQVLDSAPDAFVTLDADGIIMTWNSAAERMFGWSTAEAVGRPMRALAVPEELRQRHDDRRRELLGSDAPVTTRLFDTEFVRRDGSRFPAEATVSRVNVGGETYLPGFIRDISERQRRQDEREALLREQAARAEAERVAEMVSGMQLLVDAALAHRTLDDILADLVTRVRGVLGAAAAVIYIAEDGDRLIKRASSGGFSNPQPATLAFGEGFAGGVAAGREPMLEQDLIGVPLMAESGVIGVVVVCSTRSAR
jgi:PAS domain S-box-containing protein